MTAYDVFNGDADGICSLIQLRRAEPIESVLVTGVKRDINLLKCVEAEAGDQITALDISFQKNNTDVSRLLGDGASVLYIDHHNPGELFEDPNLEACIDTSSEVCTALIVNQRLGGKYQNWAITAAFGDNLSAVATALAQRSGLSQEETELLQTLGVCINYNGYGASLDDLYFYPDELYRLMYRFDCPFEFIEAEKNVFDTLTKGYQGDMAKAHSLPLHSETSDAAAVMLPDEKWARRVSGVFGNDLANQSPNRAHAVITQKPCGAYQVSVRAPLNNKTGADELVGQFPTGGGRKGAAGINVLPAELLTQFIAAFERQYAQD